MDEKFASREEVAKIAYESGYCVDETNLVELPRTELELAVQNEMTCRVKIWAARDGENVVIVRNYDNGEISFSLAD